jgi:hypothetical protein
MDTKIYYDSTNVVARHDLTIECLPGELIEIRPATEIEFMDGPGGTPPTIDGSQLSCTEPGRYRFRIVNMFTRQDLHVVCVEHPAVFDFVRAQVRTTDGSPTNAKVRSVIKSLANDADWFDGSLASLQTGQGPSRGLSQFGA